MDRQDFEFRKNAKISAIIYYMKKLEDIVSLCKRRGFIFPGSDVYGGMTGTWDSGPLGVSLMKLGRCETV